MDRGLYIAASGMLSELVRQDQISNDLANASTPGYKPDRAAQKSFEDLLINNTKTCEHVARLVLRSQKRAGGWAARPRLPNLLGRPGLLPRRAAPDRRSTRLRHRRRGLLRAADA